MTPNHRPRRLARTTALLAGAAVLALSATAVADSIVYVDQGNVWSGRPDGSGRVQLTDGGSWHSPTQADDGTIAAVQGTGPIVVMARDGQPLRTIATPSAKTANGGTFAARPVQLSFSPDGSKIAYAYVADSCPPGVSCSLQRSTFYTRADVTEATPIDDWGNQFSVSDPEWVTNERTLVFGGFGSQISIDDLGPGDYSQVPWVTPNEDMGDGEVSRDGKRLAATFSYGTNKTIALFAVNGDVRTQLPPPQPSLACEITPADERYGDPSWSPDGSGLAAETSNGIELLRFAAFGPDLCQTTGESVVFAAGGSEPDWGPADPAAARWVAPPREVPRETPRETPRVTPRARDDGRGGSTRATIRLAATPRPTVAALRRGLAIKVRSSTAGSVAVTLTLGRRTVAHGSARARRAGVVTVRLGKLGARAAGRLRGRRLTLTVRAGKASARTTVKVR
ncbi:hypothetical protein Q5424_22340 [Conexibacter sp. JD483]|uniref:hypothetical protein n=1 Tax=unclassified Conexibacter TaxID=2627773 RepID=UPI00271FF632|nr:MULTISPECIES: hypothetical protein [unclassified Conexibacter]MDO8187267.1 hypothetical protein [Conexibacter sp. CPCC 205706]MDO8198876.1 hypothetical protein [Conexibacter sp. CPCC 205762]MDR9371854.1 hypothetical protein [Conexibacter sp. JD483]